MTCSRHFAEMSTFVYSGEKRQSNRIQNDGSSAEYVASGVMRYDMSRTFALNIIVAALRLLLELLLPHSTTSVAHSNINTIIGST